MTKIQISFIFGLAGRWVWLGKIHLCLSVKIKQEF